MHLLTTKPYCNLKTNLSSEVVDKIYLNIFESILPKNDDTVVSITHLHIALCKVTELHLCWDHIPGQKPSTETGQLNRSI